MNATVTWLSFPSPVGTLTAFAVNNSLTVLEWGRTAKCEKQPQPVLARTRKQLDAYFDGKRKTFDLPLAPSGSRFQLNVWRAMDKIPYGKTRAYGDLASDLNSAARAVGAACGKNPIPIIVPCHRVLGANGQMTGYSGGAGIETKVQLLRLEGISLV